MKILLNDIMNKRNLSIRQVSYITDVPKSTIHKIMNSKCSPTMDTMEKIAKGLNIGIEDLYESEYKSVH